LLVVGSSILASARSTLAQRPTAPELMPGSTLAVVRIVDMPLLAERFNQTALGRIGHDPQMKPLIGSLYRSAQDAFKQVEGQVGLPLDQLLKIPQGEVCVGFVASRDPEQEAGFIVVIDTKDQVTQARKLLAAAEELARRNGGGRSADKFGEHDVMVYSGLGKGRVFGVERDGSFIFATNKPLMETVLANLSGAGLERTLADSDKYQTVMSRCSGGGDRPHITFFVDPIELIRRLASDSLAATGLALFPVLGLDGLQAVGGTMTFASGEFDQVQHFHVLLDNPRLGVIDAVALSSGDTTPEPWVPGDSISYSTIHWDLRHTLNVSARLYNGIMGDEALERELRNRISEPLGVDFEKEIVPQVTGRVSHAQWVEKPVRINSITTMVGVQLKDADAFKPTLDKFVRRLGDRVERSQYGTVTYWTVKGGQRGGRELGPNLRVPQPCFGLVGDYLVMTDSLKAFQEAVTSQTNPENSLTSSLDFKLITSKIKQQRGGDAPGAVMFQRPEEGLRFWYDLASAENTKKSLADRADRNRFFGSLNQALSQNPLPPFAVLAEYMAPAGGMIVNDETGIHYMTFTLKRQ
jgi:hypothetical protein